MSFVLAFSAFEGDDGIDQPTLHEIGVDNPVAVLTHEQAAMFVTNPSAFDDSTLLALSECEVSKRRVRQAAIHMNLLDGAAIFRVDAANGTRSSMSVLQSAGRWRVGIGIAAVLALGFLVAISGWPERAGRQNAAGFAHADKTMGSAVSEFGAAMESVLRMNAYSVADLQDRRFVSDGKSPNFYVQVGLGSPISVRRISVERGTRLSDIAIEYLDTTKATAGLAALNSLTNNVLSNDRWIVIPVSDEELRKYERANPGQVQASVSRILPRDRSRFSRDAG